MTNPDHLMKPDPDKENLGDIPRSLALVDETLGAILEGGKPRATENDWLYSQVARMFAGHFVAEDPKSFLTLPGDGDWEQEHKGETGFHPVPATLVDEHENLDLFLSESGVRNFRALGLGDEKLETLKTSARSFVLTSGDFRAAKQFVNLLAAKITGDASMADTTLVIQNGPDAFWAPLIKHLGLDKHAEALEKMSVFITDDVHKTVDTLEATLGVYKDVAPVVPKSPLNIPPGSAILVSTRNNKKIHELQAIFDGMGASVRVLPFNTILRKPPEAEETSKTYAGNNIEKIEMAIECVDQMGENNVADILNQRGLDPKKTFICVDDRGLAMVENFMADPVFDDCRSFLNPYKGMPGAELAHVLKAMGLADMYGRIEMAAKNIEDKRIAVGDKRPVDRTAIDYTNYVFCPILPNAEGTRPVRGFWGQSEDTIAKDPSPSTGVLYSENFLKPKDDPQGRTKADMPDYLEKHSAMARAIRAASRLLGFDKHAETLTANFNDKVADKRKWTIGTQYSLRPLAAEISERMFGRKTIRGGPFRFSENKTQHFDPLRVRDHWIKTAANDDTARMVRSSLNNFEDFTSESNAFVLMPERKQDDETTIRNMFTFFSLVVGKQVFDPNIAGKPVVVLKPSGDQTWAPFERLYHHLHRHGLIGDKPEHVYKVKTSSADTQEYLKRRKERHVPENVVKAVYEEQGIKQRDAQNLYRVAVYCSATSTNKTLCEKTENAGYRLAEDGFAVKYGGGTMGLMDKVSRGFHRFRAENPDSPVINHISALQCADTAASEGMCEGDDFACIHTNIYHRMEDLGDNEASLFLFGGAGTIQEVASEAILRMTGAKSRHCPMIIVNAEIGQGEHKTHVFEPLKDILTPAICRKLNVRFVSTEEEAHDILLQSRQSWLAQRTLTPTNQPLPRVA